MKSKKQRLIESAITKITRRVLTESKDQYIVQYVRGGWANWKVNTLTSKFSKEDADIQIKDLNAAGFHAVKYPLKYFRTIGGLPDSSEFESDRERKKYWDDMLRVKSSNRPDLSKVKTKNK